jgi:predicted GNAT family acetyltransferase
MVSGTRVRRSIVAWIESITSRREPRVSFDGGRYEQAMRSAEEKVQNGTLYLWVDGVPRSMAARTLPTPHGEAVGFVYTPPSQRRKGYASALVARLSQSILDDGKQFCTLYTDLANPASNRIYQQIGYSAIADVVEFVFGGQTLNLPPDAGVRPHPGESPPQSPN